MAEIPRPKDSTPIDWSAIKRVIVIRLRSIGDTVLTTPSLIALRRALPDAEIDILLEDWVAPLLNGSDIANVIPVGKSLADRVRVARLLRGRRYDVAIDMHGGSTAGLLTAATGARHRIGYASYQYPFLFNRILSSSAEFWQRERTHSAEQQLALVGFAGLDVGDKPRSYLRSTAGARARVAERLASQGVEAGGFALLHCTTSFETKRWLPENFAAVAEHLSVLGIPSVAVASLAEEVSLGELVELSPVPITPFTNLSLPEITALAEHARIFVGIDSGIAHIAGAVGTPSVVIFGYSNRDHWSPWTDAPNEIVFKHFDCQPCSGYRCEVYGTPRCILEVPVDAVTAAIDRILQKP